MIKKLKRCKINAFIVVTIWLKFNLFLVYYEIECVRTRLIETDIARWLNAGELSFQRGAVLNRKRTRESTYTFKDHLRLLSVLKQLGSCLLMCCRSYIVI